MSRRVQCPWPEFPDAWVDLPDEWLGEHAQRRDEAVKEYAEYGETLMSFAVCVRLLDNWNVPGLEGNQEQWDFNKFDLRLIGWVTQVTWSDFSSCFNIPKALSSP